MSNVSINPATGEEIFRFAFHSDVDVDAVIDVAQAAQLSWKTRGIGERTALLSRSGQVLRANAERYARLITLEMGKPRAEALAEIEKCAWNCDFYAQHAADFLADEPVETGAQASSVVFDPLGVVLSIMPWNFPFWQFFRFAAPALAAGNGIVLKHAKNVPQSALACVDVLRQAGMPGGLAGAIFVENKDVARIIADSRIAGLTLTGSTGAGAIVASQAGQALKRQVLELGGSDPFIVLADADVERAARVAVKARFLNAGQSCVNAKRFIIEEAVADRFTEAFCRSVAALRIGDPWAPETDVGPLARADLRDALHSQVVRSVAAGAKLRIGGEAVEGPGFFYRPTVLDGVTEAMPCFVEETFGPLAAISRAKDADDAVRLANSTEFGLGASLWTASAERARRIMHQLESGAVFVNAMVASDPRLPFGGIKRSGYGRELGRYGIREFTNIKSVWIEATDLLPAPTDRRKSDASCHIAPEHDQAA
ncbi:aldehyde dehydrogenase family protein [Propylenella binzhouense]|uniref:NAD-dependent succinate-semialdehyde dehydrogenase n=1 Tax=Propylenella binzhouense TaxID=2555902 RepID=A0A964WSY6_9HYPH|nr:NAD-dependent succinate-semialdehyde dehydrogenase [Propylenella binzhouense]